MEIFYSGELREMHGAAHEGFTAFLDEDESAHCIRVLRHRAADTINVIDGEGCMYECRITDPSPKHCGIMVTEAYPGWGGHDYVLHIACCPTKNMERYEWFMEKATEIGTDSIVPIIGEHSERRSIKRERSERILLSAAKQSLKSRIPALGDCMGVKEFIDSEADSTGLRLKLIAYCFHDGEADTRKDMFSETEKHFRHVKERFPGVKPEITVMIGPEGDFSEEEARHAVSRGFIPVSIGQSRLRTETAALMAVAAAYSAGQTALKDG